MSRKCDLVVIGGGTAGLTAGLFGVKHGMKVVILERLFGGGQVLNAEHIDNFPGFKTEVSGFEYGQLLLEQVEAAGVEFEMAEVTELQSQEPYHSVITSDGQYQAKAVIISAGSTLRRLGIPGEAEHHGNGVSYCATCDGAFFADEVVGVVGGGDSAMDEALTLTKFASKVIIFHRRDTLGGQKTLQDRILSNPKVRVVWNTTVQEVLGSEQVTGVLTRDEAIGATSQVGLSGLFIYIGLEPNARFVSGVLPLDNAGHIPTDLWMSTGVPGIYAAGDIRQGSAAQLVTAAGDGATAAIAAARYIQGRNWPS